MDLAKVEVAGPCRITYKGVDLGHTLGGILFRADREFTKVMADKFGSTPIDFVLNGTEASLEFTLAQTEYPQMAVSMPETASYDGAGARDRTAIGGETGFSLRSVSGPLIIHPLRLADTDLSEDINLYLAVSTDPVELPYRVDEQKVVAMKMTALVSEAYGAGRRLGHIGPADVS
jgi:hypothetical protein